MPVGSTIRCSIGRRRTLACLKTENFTFTGNRNLDQARMSIEMPAGYGFPPAQRSHLIGIGEYTTPWQKEWQLAIAKASNRSCYSRWISSA